MNTISYYYQFVNSYIVEAMQYVGFSLVHAKALLNLSYVGLALLLLWIAVNGVIHWPKWKYSGMHVVISGGSSGLGLSIAKEVAKKGAHVTIAARNRRTLKAAVAEIKAVRMVSTQKINFVAGDVTKKRDVTKIMSEIDDLCNPIDVYFNCAGASHPGLFIDSDVTNFENQMNLNYIGCVNMLKEVIERMAGIGKGHIVVLTSTLALIGVPGYGGYAASKHALVGLMHSLRSEMQLHNITTHIAYPPTMQTPGFEVEQQTKPQLTWELEQIGTDIYNPDDIARELIHKVTCGYYHITFEFFTTAMRIGGTNLSPRNDCILEILLQPITAIFGIILNYAMYVYCWWFKRKERKKKE